MTKQLKTITLQDGTTVTTQVTTCQPSNRGRKRQTQRVRTNMGDTWRVYEIARTN